MLQRIISLSCVYIKELTLIWRLAEYNERNKLEVSKGNICIRNRNVSSRQFPVVIFLHQTRKFLFGQNKTLHSENNMGLFSQIELESLKISKFVCTIKQIN